MSHWTLVLVAPHLQAAEVEFEELKQQTKRSPVRACVLERGGAWLQGREAEAAEGSGSVPQLGDSWVSGK